MLKNALRRFLTGHGRSGELEVVRVISPPTGSAPLLGAVVEVRQAPDGAINTDPAPRLGGVAGAEHETYCAICDLYEEDCRYTELWSEDARRGPRWMPVCGRCRKGEVPS